METVLKAISDWIKSLLTAAIMSNLSGLFDDVNTQVGNIAQQVGTKPSSFEPRVFAMIEALSRNVVLPIAGVILTFIACYELIEMITQHNNMAQFEPALLMKWIFKTAISVWMISNTFDIIMAVFDVTQQVVANSSGIISGNTRVNDIGLSMLQSSMMQMDVGPLFGLFLQSFFIGITMRIIFITNFIQYAPEGFEVQAFRYLLKADFSAKLDSYFDSAVQEVLQRKQLVTISINSEIIDVPVNDILYLESHRRIIVMHLLDEKRPAYQFYGNITELSEKIEPLGFLRIQKSYLVNMHYVEIFQYNKVQLRGGLCLAPSEKSYNELKQKYLHWRGKSRWML